MSRRPLAPGDAIRLARKEKKMTQAELAQAAGISLGYLIQVEHGYDSVSTDVKKSLAKALGFSVFALFPSVEITVDAYEILRARHGRDLVIKETEVAYIKEVLSRMSEDEFEALIESGATASAVKKAIRTFAKDHDIEVQT